jgi:hypothetical protein
MYSCGIVEDLPRAWIERFIEHVGRMLILMQYEFSTAGGGGPHIPYR